MSFPTNQVQENGPRAEPSPVLVCRAQFVLLAPCPSHIPLRNTPGIAASMDKASSRSLPRFWPREGDSQQAGNGWAQPPVPLSAVPLPASNTIPVDWELFVASARRLLQASSQVCVILRLLGIPGHTFLGLYSQLPPPVTSQPSFQREC